MTPAELLEAEIRTRIERGGPMPVAQFMALCLTHPEHGYYMNRDPFGAAGDFTTAPEISQMFGELIGLWAAQVWQMMGAPQPVNLIELGPGRGTLMADALRAAQVMPPFAQAIRVHLVEVSPRLRQMQQQKLGDTGKTIRWADSIKDVPQDAAIIVANEFIDALPIHQAVRQPDGWHERTVAIDSDGRLAFAMAREPLPSFECSLPERIRAAPVGAIFEWRAHVNAFEIARRAGRGGAGLIIDYGHVHSDVGDTFQAVGGHRYRNPLSAPGSADLTAQVDFEALATAAVDAGARVHGPLKQACFLKRLGIAQRAAALKAKAPAESAAAIDAALDRLLAGGATGMGAMFKVIGFSHASVRLPGFADGRPTAAPTSATVCRPGIRR